MNLLKVLFYYHQRLADYGNFSPTPYKRNLKALFCLGFLIIVPTCALTDYIAQCNGFIFDRMPCICAFVISVFGILYFTLVHNGKGQKIFDSKPRLFKSDGWSLTIFILFDLLSITTTLLVASYLEKP